MPPKVARSLVFETWPLKDARSWIQLQSRCLHLCTTGKPHVVFTNHLFSNAQADENHQESENAPTMVRRIVRFANRFQLLLQKANYVEQTH
jgi:hypothetical protein